MRRKDKKKLVREIVDAYRSKDERRLELLIREAEDTLLDEQVTNSEIESHLTDCELMKYVRQSDLELAG